MFILFDNNVPKGLRRRLPGHLVRTAYEMNWAHLEKGSLLAAAERARFELFITADQNMEYQQNLVERRVALIILGSAQWPYVVPHVERILEAVARAAVGSYDFIPIPRPPKLPRFASK